MGVGLPSTDHPQFCTDGDKLAKYIVRHGFRGAILKMATEYLDGGSSVPVNSPPSDRIFTIQERAAIRGIVLDEMKTLTVKVY